MKGKHAFVVSNRFAKYEFEIKRNITIIQGNSATGKSTLLNMLGSYAEDSVSSGITVICDVPFFVYRSGGSADWNTVLQFNEGSIIFIEEDYDFVSTTEFARFVEHSDSYFVIITRENLKNLPYSVEEIYCIKESGKYGTAMQVYNVFENIYVNRENNLAIGKEPDEFECVITEDSKAGFQFFTTICQKNQKRCVSALGKSNIVRCIRENKNQKLLIIVDGAAFGSQLQDILKNTYDYVESREYMSWERFYTALLVKESEGKTYQYNKNSLNEYFLGEKMIKKVKVKFKILDRI